MSGVSLESKGRLGKYRGMPKPLLSKRFWDADGSKFPDRNRYPSPELIAGCAERGKAFAASACCHRLVIGLQCIFTDLPEFIFSFTW